MGDELFLLIRGLDGHDLLVALFVLFVVVFVGRAINWFWRWRAASRQPSKRQTIMSRRGQPQKDLSDGNWPWPEKTWLQERLKKSREE